MPGAPPCSAALPAATSGAGARRTVSRPFASSATRISSGPTAPSAVATVPPPSLADTVAAQWRATEAGRYVVLTGGEPLLQVDAALIEALHARGFEIGVETNGTMAAPEGLDWICVSPKGGSELVLRQGHELKLVYPQALAAPERFENLAFERFSLQPMDGPEVIENTARAIDYCLHHPQWRLSVQTHKSLGIR